MKLFKQAIFLFLLTGIVLFSACGDGKPRNIISQEKMQAILWDVAMAGEFANGYVYFKNPAENRATINNELLKEIYKVHGITGNQFEKSLEYYKTQPKLFTAILDSITARQSAPPVPEPSGLPQSAPVIPAQQGNNDMPAPTVDTAIKNIPPQVVQ